MVVGPLAVAQKQEQSITITTSTTTAGSTTTTTSSSTFTSTSSTSSSVVATIATSVVDMTVIAESERLLPHFAPQWLGKTLPGSILRIASSDFFGI